MNKILASAILILSAFFSIFAVSQASVAQPSDANTCPLGTYSSTGYSSVTESITCSVAPAGTYVDTSGATAPTPCAAGSYQPDERSVLCLQSPAGTFAPERSTAPQTCADGRFSLAGAGFCTPAAPGHFATASNRTMQVACQAGMYQPLSGQTSCDQVPAGNYTNDLGSPFPIPCPAGSFQPLVGSITCDQSAPGTYAPQGATAALPCAAGTFAAAAQGACTPASLGHFVDSTDKTREVACSPGTYQSLTGQSSCQQAAPGHYVSDIGASVATPCQLGAYQPNAGTVTCIRARIGMYVDTVGASSAIACPSGFTTLGVSSTMASDCSISTRPASPGTTPTPTPTPTATPTPTEPPIVISPGSPKKAQSIAALKLPKKLKVSAKLSLAKVIPAGLAYKAKVVGPCKLSATSKRFNLKGTGKAGTCKLTLSNNGNAGYLPLRQTVAIRMVR